MSFSTHYVELESYPFFYRNILQKRKIDRKKDFLYTFFQMTQGYRTVKDTRTGQRRRAHRVLAERALGRPLMSGEIVHHRDGNKANNAPENLLVLPSQAYHAHLEYHLRCEKRGMPCLFPELFTRATGERRSTLFEHLSL